MVGLAMTRGRPRSRPRSRTHSSVWAPTTSTVPAGATGLERPDRGNRGAIAELIEAGYVRAIELSRSERRRSGARRPCTPSPICRSSTRLFPGSECQILPVCRELGIAITAYGVLSRGLIGATCRRSTASPAATSAAVRHAFRERTCATTSRRRSAASDRRNQAGLGSADRDRLGALAGRGHRAPSRARARQRLQEALEALELELTPDDLSQIEQAVPAGAAAGERYPQAQMAQLDSER